MSIYGSQAMAPSDPGTPPVSSHSDSVSENGSLLDLPIDSNSPTFVGDQERAAFVVGVGESSNKRQHYADDKKLDHNLTLSFPCPFRDSDPAYYDKNNKDTFSECHTIYHDIPAVV